LAGADDMVGLRWTRDYPHRTRQDLCFGPDPLSKVRFGMQAAFLVIDFWNTAPTFGTLPVHGSQRKSQLAHFKTIILRQNSDLLLFSQSVYLFS
jgi:hypothetical protein